MIIRPHHDSADVSWENKEPIIRDTRDSDVYFNPIEDLNSLASIESVKIIQDHILPGMDVFSGASIDFPEIDLSIFFVLEDIDTTASVSSPSILQAEISLDNEISTGFYGDVYLWSYPVQLPLTEILEWKTSFLESRSGKTQAAKMREFPRQIFKVVTHSSDTHRRNFRNLLIPNQDKLWALPDWREVSRVTLEEGATSLEIEFFKYGFWPPKGLAIFWESYSNWEIIEYEFDGESLSFPPIQNDWENIIFMPLRIGHIVEIPKIHQTELYTKVEFRFQALVNDTDMLIDTDLPNLLDMALFNNIDLYERCPLYKGRIGVKDQIQFREDRFDPKTGKFSVNYPWDCPRQKRELFFYEEGRDELLNFYGWLYRRSGRFRSFFMPTWTRDLELDTTGTLYICFFIIPTVLDPCHDEIAFRTKDGRWRIRTIVDSRYIGPQLEIRIDVPLNIEAEDVERISYLRQYILERDRVEILHHGGFSYETTIPIIENDEIKLPTIRTTTPYPLMGTDEIDISSSVYRHRLARQYARNEDSANISIELTSGFFGQFVNYIDYIFQHEVEISASITTVAIGNVAYVDYDMEDEVSISAEVVSGLLVPVVQYITRDIEEEIEVDFEFIGGSLYE